MSDTPRTQEFYARNSSYLEKLAFTELLERELHESNARVLVLRDKIEDLDIQVDICREDNRLLLQELD